MPPPTPLRLATALLCAGALWLSSPAGAQHAAGSAAAAHTLSGSWTATLRVGSFPLRLVLNIAPRPGGTVDGTLVSVDQGGAEVPLAGRVHGDSVRVVMESIAAAFAGRLSPDGGVLEGRWEQDAVAVPLRFTRAAAPPLLGPRPQEPARPLPYHEEEVEFASSAGGVRLAGTLTLPAGPGPHPAVVLVSGSGPHDRDGAMMGHRPFLVLADHLTRGGVAVLRVDDRGIGGSGGSFAEATLADFADDARGAVRYLAGRSEVAPGRIGLVGHSEGAVVSPLAAAGSPEVAFVVMLAGTGVPGDSILRLQTDLLMRASGIPADRSSRLAGIQVRMFGALRGGDGAEAALRLRTAAAEFVGEFSEAERSAAGLTVEQVEELVRSLMTPALRMLLDHDPAAVLRRLTVPVLALNGGRDLQVPPRENLDAIAAALEAGGNPDFTVVELPGLNHLFQTALTGAPAEYARIEETFSPDALRLVTTWITGRFGMPAPERRAS